MKEAPSARLFLSGFEHDSEIHADAAIKYPSMAFC
jgi:hypothetical protein